MSESVVITFQNNGDHWTAYCGPCYRMGKTKEEAQKKIIQAIKQEYDRQGWSIELRERGEPYQLELL